MGDYLQLFLNNLKNFTTKRLRSPFMWSAPLFILVLTLFTPMTHALSFDQQIKELKHNSARVQSRKQELSSQALTLSGTIQGLTEEVKTLDHQVADTRGKVDGLKKDITKAEKDLRYQRKLLGTNVRKMYVEQDMTPLEMLASSYSFSHYVDQEQYRSNLQEKINDSSNHIKKLAGEMNREKKSVEDILSDQRTMQERMIKQRAKAEKLFGLNKEQQRVFQNDLRANAAKEAVLQHRQAQENQKGFINRPHVAKIRIKPVWKKHVDGTKYPWAHVAFPNTKPDPWGMFKRQCVSYTAWKVAASGRHMPYWGGRGNAKMWDDNARRAGIPVSNRPHVGDVAISNYGTYGHAMYVEKVHRDGTVTVSQYNAGWDGRYSVGRRSAFGLAFVHFR